MVLPFATHRCVLLNLLRNYGEDSEVYRDLKFSFVNFGGAMARNWKSVS